MLFVLDTNILVASLSSKSEEHWTIERLLNDRDFRKLKQIEFPKLLLLRLADFKKCFKE